MGRTPGSKSVEPVSNALERGISHLLSQQKENGCWEGEMVWCTMILSQYVIVQRITGRPFDDRTRSQIVKYFRATRTPEGVWGLHPESSGYVFFTTLAYVALRLVGISPDDPLLAAARQWLRAQKGGVLAIPSWGKFWLAMLGLYQYEGVNPIPPEIFLLPRALPFHPHHYYCHTRHIYLAMAYLYGTRFRADLGAIVAELRTELYDQPYERLDFATHRHELAPTDVYVRPSRWLLAAYDCVSVYERRHLGWVRRWALDRCFDGIVFEQQSSRYQALSPVSGLLNCLAIWSRNPNHTDLPASLEGLERWKWE